MKATKTSKQAVAQQVVAVSAEEKLKDEIENLEHNMRAALRVSSSSTTAVTEKFQNAFNALYALEWMESHAVNIAIGALVEKVVAYTDVNRGETMNVVDAVEETMNQERENLMRNQYRGSSTSAWHNATEGAKREAAVRFIDNNARCIERIRKLQAEIAAKHTS